MLVCLSFWSKEALFYQSDHHACGELEFFFFGRAALFWFCFSRNGNWMMCLEFNSPNDSLKPFGAVRKKTINKE